MNKLDTPATAVLSDDGNWFPELISKRGSKFVPIAPPYSSFSIENQEIAFDVSEGTRRFANKFRVSRTGCEFRQTIIISVYKLPFEQRSSIAFGCHQGCAKLSIVYEYTSVIRTTIFA